MKKTLLIVLCTSFLFSQIREEITERHENGVKKTIIIYKGTGTKENLIKKLKYYDNENIKSSTEWNHGIEDGLYTYWYNDGQKEQEGTYKGGEKDGKWTKWYNDGQKQSEETLKNKKEDGLWTYWHKNGHKKSEKKYSDGKGQGLWTYWDKNGQKKKETSYEDGNLVDEWTFVLEYHENGEKKVEGTLKNKKEDGLWTYWHTNGQKKREVIYKDGKRFSYKTWNRDSSVKE